MTFGNLGNLFFRGTKPKNVISILAPPVIAEVVPVKSVEPLPLVKNNFRAEDSYRAEGIYGYQRGVEINPYRSGTREAKYWQKGYLEEHQRNPKAPTLPDWIDHTQWNVLPLSARLNGIQAVMLVMGDEGTAGMMTQLRGLPAESPKWLIKEAWDRGANSRYVEAKALERFVSL